MVSSASHKTSLNSSVLIISLIFLAFSPLTTSSPVFRGNQAKTDVPFPVIGVLTQPSPFATNGYPKTEFSYIAASYIKNLESAGAEVVPIQWDLPFDQMDALLEQVNGVLFPGGGTGLVNSTTKGPTIFSQTGLHILAKAMEFNNNGDYFPLWGTCLGYELLVMSVANDFSILIDIIDGNDTAKPIAITTDGLSGMYSYLSDDLVQDVQNGNLSYFHHKKTPNPDAFTNNSNLITNFTIASWTYDSVIDTYVASLQGKAHPFMGSQFHPEKNSFEWYTQEIIPHTLQAVNVQQFYAYYFVNQTSQSKHRFKSQANFLDAWIYNTQPKHLGPDFEFDQIYFFKNYMTYSPTMDLISEYPAGTEEMEKKAELEWAAKHNGGASQMNEDKKVDEDLAFKFKELSPFIFA